MPTYDFRCANGHVFEIFRKMTDASEERCPNCGDPATRQITGGTGFRLGGGPTGESQHAPKDVTGRR